MSDEKPGPELEDLKAQEPVKEAADPAGASSTKPATNVQDDCDDPELEDLLQSTLNDFAAKPKLGGAASTSGAAGGSGDGDGGPDADWDEEKFVADATAHFERSMRALLSAAETGGGPGATETELSKVFEQIFQGVQPPPAPPSGPGACADPMEEMMRMMATMQMGGLGAGLGDAGAGSGASASGADASPIFPLMSGLLKQVLSKDVLYPALQAILNRFPAYMEENRGKLKDEDVKRYEEQQRLMKRVLDEFDSEDGANFEKIFNLMQEMQEHGHPPKEVLDGAENPLDLSNLGLDPGQLSSGQSDCTLS